MTGLKRRAMLGAAATLAVAPRASAQAFPTKPMRFLVPYPVGGIVDIFLVQHQPLGEKYGYNVFDFITPRPSPDGAH